ncbi:MAG: HRDC domain-containing protein [Deltaproteobacteria bacterium]|nr:HRDC domain-containing protein [Deltaproteobacteria bacterium]
MIGKESPKRMDKNKFSYEWIETLPHLEGVARILGQAKIIGVDLEADSLYHYFEKVCLIQIATESASYVIDPLALRDLSALRPVLSNPRIRKVFHGADYDIRSLYRDFRLEVENLFDTQLACKFLGLRESGLEALLRSRFHVELNKKYQRADWSQRPLSPEMVEYAAMDGMYLIPLARMLEKELEEKGRLFWVEEECLFLSKVRFTPPSHTPLYLKVKGAFLLDPRSLAVLEALLEFREAQAQKSDLPPFKVFRNELLLELAMKKPLRLEELETAKVLSRKQIDRYGTRLLQEIHRAMAIPDEELPVYPREGRPDLSSPLRKRVKALKTWRDMRANHLEVEPGILMNNALINGFALKNPRSIKEMEGIPGLKKWLQDHFGREILAAQIEIGKGVSP